MTEETISNVVSEPLTLNPVLNLLLKQLVNYILTHAEEIVKMLLALLPGNLVTEDIELAADAFKAGPTEATFKELTDLITAATEGPSADAVAFALTSHVMQVNASK